MKLLALDVSEKSTGWFLSKRSCGRIQPDPKLSFDERLVAFREQLAVLLEKYKPTLVVIEDVYLRWNVQTFKQLSMLQGVARELATEMGIQVATLTATQARKYCCGPQEGKFKKPEVFAFIVQKYGFSDFDFDSHNDITDAAALLLGYKNKLRGADVKNSTKKKRK